MAKTGPLGDVEKFYIENKFNEEPVEKLAKKLNRPKAAVEKHIEKCKLKTTTEGNRKKDTIFASQRGATVMTQAASELGDDIKKKNASRNKVNKKCTTNIK